MKPDWGRFTVKGNDQVEGLITSMVEKIASAVSHEFRSDQYEALVMLGGYGRGEGGVQKVDGVFKPHNNFDLLLIVTDQDDITVDDMNLRLNNLFQSLSRELDIGIDCSIFTASKLRNSDCRVIWYDMRFGHKTLLGNKDFVPSLYKFTKENIPHWDARNLMVNRGTLFVINELLLQQSELSVEYKKLLIKHAIKAIIGYGDTLLFFHNDYDWSYAEKQRRMKKRDDISNEIKRVYDEAIEFRFQPEYEAYLQKDMKQWMGQLRDIFAEIHKSCESLRLNKPDLDWESYPDEAFRYALFDDLSSIRSIAKKGVRFLKSPSYPGSGGMKAALGYRSLGTDGVLPVLFPLIAYNVSSDYFKELVMKILNARSTDSDDLRKAYLKAWGIYGDINFGNVLKKYNINIQVES